MCLWNIHWRPLREHHFGDHVEPFAHIFNGILKNYNKIISIIKQILIYKQEFSLLKYSIKFITRKIPNEKLLFCIISCENLSINEFTYLKCQHFFSTKSWTEYIRLNVEEGNKTPFYKCMYQGRNLYQRLQYDSP